MHFIDEIKNRAQMEIKTIALPETYDERVLKAAVKAESEKIAKIILVGDRKKTLEDGAFLHAPGLLHADL
mgnify:CR=1 FL=1